MSPREKKAAALKDRIEWFDRWDSMLSHSDNWQEVREILHEMVTIEQARLKKKEQEHNAQV